MEQQRQTQVPLLEELPALPVDLVREEYLVVLCVFGPSGLTTMGEAP